MIGVICNIPQYIVLSLKLIQIIKITIFIITASLDIYDRVINVVVVVFVTILLKYSYQ